MATYVIRRCLYNAREMGKIDSSKFRGLNAKGKPRFTSDTKTDLPEIKFSTFEKAQSFLLRVLEPVSCFWFGEKYFYLVQRKA